ncbi:hypothetical protein D3C76_1033760 [compost metagenome]
MGVQRAGAVALAPVDAVAVTFGDQARANVLHSLAAGFRQGIGEAMALQYQVVEVALLLRAALQADVFQQAVVVLRNLPKRRVGSGDDGDHPGECGERYLGATIGPWHGDAPQPAVGKCVDDVGGYFAVAVAFGGALAQQPGDLMSDGQRFGVVANDVRRRWADFVSGRYGQVRHEQLECSRMTLHCSCCANVLVQ